MSEQDTQVQDSATNESQEQELEINLDDIETVEAQPKMYTEEQFRQVVARAKKAEGELKATKQSASKETQPINKPSFTDQDIDAKVLEAQGTPEDELETLKKIAQLEGISIIKAREHNLFKLFKTQKEEDEKANKAKLGASKGSGSVKKAPGFNTPGLSQEDHRALWREKNGLN
jgi:hypothetical protein